MSCPSCGAAGLEIFYEQDDVPVHSCRLVDTREAALAFPRGSLRLGLCRACGFISNTAFDASVQDYSLDYEETQAFSPRFQDFARGLAERWIEKHALRHKDVLEIGCGKGDFLVLLCELGPNRGIGIDPSVVEERVNGRAPGRVSFLRELYGPHHAALPADAVVCRHTLEHIHPVGDFLRLVRDGIAGRDAVFLFELPDVMRVLREGAFWDVYYEHCSYFSPGSLARLFRRSGLEVLDLALDYDDQYVLIEARPGGNGAAPLPLEEPPEDVARAAAEYRRRFDERRDRWTNVLREGRRTVIWGAGSKGVAFLTTLGLRDEIECAVDVNPYKQGKYVAGTGHEIVSPARLREVRPDVVVVMNPVYLGEVEAELEGLGLRCEVLAA